MTSIRTYLSLVKFSHTIFAMPFAVIGFLLGMRRVYLQGNVIDGVIREYSSETYLALFCLVLVCMVTARNAAMAFNRWADRKFDKENIRTKVREIPSGIISEKNALVFVVVNCLLFVTTTFFINPICFYLSPVALLVVLGYSYTKRFTPLCHLVLGLGLSLAPIGAFLAITGRFELQPVLYSFVVFFWVSGFDIIYALQDEEFDRLQDLKSIPVLMGRKNALLLSRFLHLVAAFLVVYAGSYAGFHLWYWIGAALFIALLTYQHTLVRPNDLSKVNLAFFTTNGIASVAFAVCFLLEFIFPNPF